MIRFEYSADENLLYVALGDGPAAETLEVEASVYLDRGRELPEEGGRAEVAPIEVDLDALHSRLAAESATQAGRDRVRRSS